MVYCLVKLLADSALALGLCYYYFIIIIITLALHVISTNALSSFKDFR